MQLEPSDELTLERQDHGESPASSLFTSLTATE